MAFLKKLLITTGALAGLSLVVAGCGDEQQTSSAGPDRLYLLTVPPHRGAVKQTPLKVVDVATGDVTITRLPRGALGDPPYFLDYTGGRLVYFGAGGDTYAINPDLEGNPTRLGESFYFVPSATPGRVWLIHHQPRAVSEVTVDGEVTVEPGARAPCQYGVAALKDGLLCQRIIAPTDRFGFVNDRGAFSPDSSLLAVPVVTTDCPHPLNACRVALVDVATGRGTLIRGPKLNRDALTWSPDGGRLFYAATRGRIISYSAGHRRARPLPFRLHGGYVLDMVAG